VSLSCAILPPDLLRAVALGGTPEQRERATRTLHVDEGRRRQRAQRARPVRPTARAKKATGGPQRTIADAGHLEQLPGRTVRKEGARATGDAAADEAYDGLGQTWTLYDEVYQRDSLDGHGLPLLGSVHYGTDYDNAFWDGTQMVFGDGDNELFGRFTASLDVIGHELTHGVTEIEAGLVYSGQSGALNESLSDVFGSLVKQHALGQSADEADWLIGAELLRPGVEGVALRSMKAPGTAYDDDVLGKDPQPATMAGYVDTTDDDGGVHTNSGIPNHAFYLASVAAGGNAWETTGKVWYAALRDPALTTTATFAAFAAITVRLATPARLKKQVADAWEQVGVSAS
jgi:Zn-dependent metalloprotease